MLVREKFTEATSTKLKYNIQSRENVAVREVDNSPHNATGAFRGVGSRGSQIQMFWEAFKLVQIREFVWDWT